MQAAIGVFDSGVGGLSILASLRQSLTSEPFVYIADSAHTPYGERGDAFVLERSEAILKGLRQRMDLKAFVVACNTATAAAIAHLRSLHPELPIIGVEPALKPARLHSRTQRIGVLATRGTLASSKFADLLARQEGPAEYLLQACDGLAHAIEQAHEVNDDAEVRALCQRYTQALGAFGSAPGQIDALVLGCTHYAFAAPTLRQCVGPEVQFFETGEAVARRTREVLQGPVNLLAAPSAHTDTPLHSRPALQLLATGEGHTLQHKAAQWLHCHEAVQSFRV